MVKQFKYFRQILILSVLKKLVWIVLVFTSAVYAQKENKYIRNGNNEYEEKNYKEAEVDYMKALEKSPESYKGQYNLGGALYKQENYEDATKLYNNLTARETGKDARADAWYNLGNSLLKSEKYAESVEAYKNALRSNPDDMDAKYNLAYAIKKLQQQQQEQQNKEQDQNKDQQQDQKDQQKQDQQEQEQDQKDQQQQNQEQQQNQQQQEQQQQNQQNSQQQQPQQISKQDAERMLQALKNDENKTLEKVRLQQMQATRAKKVEKDW